MFVLYTSTDDSTTKTLSIKVMSNILSCCISKVTNIQLFSVSMAYISSPWSVLNVHLDLF